MSERVVVLGASNRPDRYSQRALRMLREHGHEVVPVHPSLLEIDGIPVAKNLASVEGRVDTLTLYVNPTISEQLAEEIVSMRPRRIIFNPGTESSALRSRLDEESIPWEEACTLVLLGTGSF